jgi:Glycosyl transferases group 1
MRANRRLAASRPLSLAAVSQPRRPRSAARSTADDELEPGRRRAARERDRLELEIDRLQAALAERSAALARSRSALERLQRDPVVRLYRAVRRLGARVRRRGGSETGPGGDRGGPTSERIANPTSTAKPIAPPTSRPSPSPSPSPSRAGRAVRVGFLGTPSPAVPTDHEAGVDAGQESGHRKAVVADGPRWQLVPPDQEADVMVILDTDRFRHDPHAALRLALGSAGDASAAGEPWLADIEGLVARSPDLRDALAAAHGACELVTDPADLDSWLPAVLERPRVAIRIGPPDWAAAGTWGDTWFARSLAAAFRRRGWLASVLVASEEASRPALAADLAIHLVGIRKPTIHPGQLSVLWVISHPDAVRAAACERYAAVFVASDLFAGALRDRVQVPVVALHQATDPGRFYPESGGPAHELLFVGNSRNRHRPVLDALRDSSWDLAVYGTNWRAELLDPRRVRGEWVANEELHRYYAAARINLNDHWPDMRDEGFISNRLYDILASGGFAISDAVPGLAEEFDSAIPGWEDPDGLRSLIDRYLADTASRDRAAERGRAAVLARHTFEHRVETILATVRPIAQARGATWASDSAAARPVGRAPRRRRPAQSAGSRAR